MNKTAKKLLITCTILVLLVAGGIYIMKDHTKSFSPEDTVTYSEGDLTLKVFYNRPYKKGREIFGELVPYNKVWRTGANEATTFYTSEDILVDGSLLKAGKYTLWTIPQEDSWKVIFNSEMYNWGINLDGEAARLPEHDVLTIEVPVNKIYNVVEQFSIYFEPSNGFVFMFMAWDRTIITIPIKEIEA